ncbi:monoglyceride lipase-like isoform X1 [Dermacentor albipictus]|uniref:monoglyceride lipase-like isoform X1 n=1 Tax=Dermacentor albipictus TaxID=60249 RepID=UPI0038FD1A5A
MSNESIRVDDRTSFLNEDGHNIVCTTWRTDAEPRALLFVAHGYGDYSQDQAYKALAYATVGLGFYVFSHDHVGHGKSEGPRGTIRSFDIYLQDILTHIDMEQAKFPGKPVYLFGHSMGGLLVILAALRRPRGFAGMVLMSPLLGLNTPYYSRFTTYLARLLVCIMPCLPTATASVDQSCRDAAVVNRMNNDPLYYVGSVCLRWVVAMVDAIEAAHAHVSAVELPFLLLYGTGDKVCDPQASRDFFEKASSKDKNQKVYEDAYHSLLEEPDGVGQQVLKDIIDWFCARLPPRMSTSSQPGTSGQQDSTMQVAKSMTSNP